MIKYFTIIIKRYTFEKERGNDLYSRWLPLLSLLDEQVSIEVGRSLLHFSRQTPLRAS
jgi:hypothetical protein